MRPADRNVAQHHEERSIFSFARRTLENGVCGGFMDRASKVSCCVIAAPRPCSRSLFPAGRYHLDTCQSSEAGKSVRLAGTSALSRYFWLLCFQIACKLSLVIIQMNDEHTRVWNSFHRGMTSPSKQRRSANRWNGRLPRGLIGKQHCADLRSLRYGIHQAEFESHFGNFDGWSRMQENRSNPRFPWIEASRDSTSGMRSGREMPVRFLDVRLFLRG